LFLVPFYVVEDEKIEQGLVGFENKLLALESGSMAPRPHSLSCSILCGS